MTDMGGNSVEQLLSLIERIEALEIEKRDLSTAISAAYKDGKSAGLDTKVMRQLIKERRMDKDDLVEAETLLNIYRRALGMLSDTPLGEAAMARAATE